MKTVLAALAGIVAVSWIYLLAGAGMPTMDMGGGKVMLMPPPSWSVGYAAIIFVMWTIMMVAMMIPSAAPTILRVANRAHGLTIAAFFTSGYLIVWTGFSALATVAQWAFDSAHVLSDSMAIRSEVAAGLIVVAAGLYQLSPVKRNCLRRCCSSKNLFGDDRTTSLQWGGPPCPPPLRESMAGTAARPTIKSDAMRQGIQLRRFMLRLLLGADVPAVRRRRDEHLLDRSDHQSGSWLKRHSHGACASRASPQSA